MRYNINPDFKKYQEEIVAFFENFDSFGTAFIEGNRNKIKLFPLGEMTVSIKSFKVPNLINRLVYRFFRKSKAKRSFEYANRLIALGINTPLPLACAEEVGLWGFGKSFYACQHLDVDLTFRELVEIPNYPDYDTILSQFIAFCYQLHEKGIEFLDHSPGNTLIKKVGEGRYEFFLVDLNRMKFHSVMNFECRMKNLSHLTPRKEMVLQMSAFYHKHYPQKTESHIFERMWFYTDRFQIKFHNKMRLKKKLKFWK